VLRRPHRIRLQHRIHHGVGRRRHAERASECDNLAAEPGQFQSVAAFEVKRHRGFYRRRCLVVEFENTRQRIGRQRDALGAADVDDL
jgi:hypothetical protein